jgi:hypothetical protein
MALASLFGTTQLVAFLAFERLLGFMRLLLDLAARDGTADMLVVIARRAIIAFALIWRRDPARARPSYRVISPYRSYHPR